MPDRIATFAREMTPALAEMAGRAISRTRKIQAEERQTAINAIFGTFKARETGTVSPKFQTNF